jgi:hypothetical protein
MDRSHSSALAVGRVSTIDLWKLLAVVLMTVDHYGHFLADDMSIWRAIGRPTVPIWFFLIGFARSRDIPVSWLVVGAILTALDIVYNDGLEDSLVNILFSFALIRLALPYVERVVAHSTAALAGTVVLLIAIEPYAGAVIEYGAVGWLFALVGLLHRRWLDAAERADGRVRVAVAVLAAAYFARVEYGVHEFPPAELAVLATLLVAITVGLVFLQPGLAPVQLPEPVARVLRLAGRATLWLYAVPLIGLYLWGIWDGAGEDDGD